MFSCHVSLLEYDQAAAGRRHLGAEVLQAKLLTGADAVGGARRAGQPAVVHPGLEAPVLALPLSLLPLRLLQLPAELQHQGVSDHVGRVPSGAPVIWLIPVEPGGHGTVLLHSPPDEGKTIRRNHHTEMITSDLKFNKIITKQYCQAVEMFAQSN